MQICVNVYNFEKLIYFTQNYLVKVALKEKKCCERLIYNLAIAEVYSEPRQISMMKHFAKIVNS